MAMYKCPAHGDCERADKNEVFERGPGQDLACPGCGTPLELQSSQLPAQKKGKTPVIASIIGAALLVIGGGTALYVSHAHKAASTVEAAAPAAPAPASDAAPQTAVSVGIAPSAEEIAADRKAGEKDLTTGDASGAESASNRAAAKEMIKVAIADMAQGKLDAAEKELIDAQARDPKQSLVWYNLGVLRLKQSRTDDALKSFEASFLNGFPYFDAMAKDPDLDGIRKDPRFQALVKKYHPETA